MNSRIPFDGSDFPSFPVTRARRTRRVVVSFDKARRHSSSCVYRHTERGGLSGGGEDSRVSFHERDGGEILKRL